MKQGPAAIARALSLATVALAAASAHAATCRYAFPVRDAVLSGASLKAGAIVPMPTCRHPGRGELWIEAENASAITGPVTRVDDKQASGGTFVHIPDRTYGGRAGAAAFAVSCAKAGTYRLWVRTFWPDIGSNSFLLGLDRAEEHVFGNTEGPGQLRRWFWLAAKPWTLTKGTHTIVVRWREDGTRLDKVVLTASPGFAPTGLGGPGARSAMPSEMSATTADCVPPRVTKWRRISLQGTALPPSAQVHVSLDGGSQWHKPGADGSLAALPARGDGSDKLRCRVVVPQPNPRLAIPSIAVSYEGEPMSVTIGNERVTITFDVTRGTLLSIVNKASSPPRTVVHGTGALPLALHVFDPGQKKAEAVPAEAIRFAGYRVWRRPEGSKIALLYRAAAGGGELRATCTVFLPRGTPISQWHVEVANGTKSLEIVEIEFPLLHGVRIGRKAEDDWLIFPRWGGGHRIPHPAQRAPGRGHYLGGTGIMNWLDVYDGSPAGAQGLYLASYDQALLMGALRAQASPEDQSVTLGMSKMPRVAPGSTFRSEPFVVAAHTGDWHWAADQYRTWIQSWMKPYRPPQWLVESDGWLGRGRGTNFLKDIPAAYRFARELGLNHVEFWGHMMVGRAIHAGGCNRLYFPDPRYGTEADFAKAIRYVRQAGGHIGFYTNGQAWNPRYPKLRPEYEGLMPPNALVPDWEDGFKKWALRRPDGSFVQQYAKPTHDDSPYPCSFYLMCAAAQGWQDYLHHYIVEKYVREYGVDHMYVDQLGAARAQMCFARGHGHDDAVGAWSRGNMEKFRRFKEDGRRHEPQFSLSTEGFGDAYGQYVDAFLISPASTRAWPYSAPEVVRYTFPEYVCLDGFANGNTGGGPREDVVCKVFLLGNRFDLFVRPGDFADWCKQVIRLRQETSELLYRGTFRDEIGLTVSDPRVRAKLWRLDSADAKGWLVTLWNPDKVADARVRVAGADSVSRAFVASLDNTPLAPCKFARVDGAAEVRVPADLLGTVLLLERSKPCLLRAWCALAATGAANAVELRFRPLAKGLPPTATAQVLAPKGWEAEPVQFPTAVSRDVELPLAIPASVRPGGHHVRVRVDAGPFAWERELGLLLVERFEASVRAVGRDVVVTLVNRGREAASGRCRLSLSGQPGITQSKPVSVPASAACEVVFDDVLPAKVATRSQARAVFECSAGRATAAMAIAPPDMAASQWRRQDYEQQVGYSVEAQGKADEALAIESVDRSARAAWGWRSNTPAPGTTWTFSAECRTQAIASKDGGARVRIIFFHRSKPNTGAAPQVLTQPLRGTQDWTPLRCQFTVPPECGRVQIELFVWHASGKATWRKLRLE